jgi:hypothetical protein
MSQFGTPAPALSSSGVTNGREVAAYAIAQAVKISFSYALSYSGLLSPIYIAAFRNGGQPAILGASFVISAFWGTAALILFLLLRAMLGGVPAMIAQPGRRRVTTRGGEIGAYAIAYLSLTTVVLALNGAFLAPIYVSMNRNGQGQIVFAMVLATTVVAAAIVYCVFIGLRAAFCRR